MRLYRMTGEQDMIGIVAIALFLFQPTPPAIHVVSAASDVLPGQAFTVTITVFGDVGDVTLDTGGLEVVSSDGGGVLWRSVTGPRTLHVTLRGKAVGDATLTARGGGMVSRVLVRVCCKEAPPAVQRRHLLYMPVFRG
jgi:hypothetical protein